MVLKKSDSGMTRWILLGLVLFSFAWRIQNLDGQSLWRDETDAIYFALRDLPATLSMFVETAQNGALYFLFLRPWLGLMGSSEFVLRYLSLIFGVLSVPLLWQLARRLMPVARARSHGSEEEVTRTSKRRDLTKRPGRKALRLAPLIAVVLLAMNPYHLWYSQEGKMYTLIIFLALLATWFWLKGIEQGGLRPWLGFLVVISLAIYTHLLLILLIPLFLVWFLIAWPKSKGHWKGFVLALAGLTLPYLPLLIWQWELLTTQQIVTELAFVPLPEVVKTLLSYHSHSFIDARNSLYLVPIFGLGLVGLFTRHQTRYESGPKSTTLSPVRRLLLVLAWLIVPVLSIYLLSLRQPVFLPRYVIWIAPAAMMILALGLENVWNSRDRLTKTLAVLLLIYVTAYWGAIGWQEKHQVIKTDLRSAIAYVAEHRQPEELLIIQIPNLNVAYQYYSSDQGPQPFYDGHKRLGWWAAGLSTAGDLGGEAAQKQVAEQMRGLTFGATDIWVMLSETELADPDHLMTDWLDGEAKLVQQIDFRGAQVRQYQMDLSDQSLNY
jgi:hypothetical protein